MRPRIKTCFAFNRSHRKQGSKNLAFNDYISDRSSVSGTKQGMTVVELIKKEGSTLGIILSGGADKDSRPQIASLRPGSIAHRSDCLSVGDYILSVNGIQTENLKHEEIVNLLKNAQGRVILDVQYEIPDSPTQMVMNVCSKVIQIRLCKDNGSFGFTVRGGVCDENLKSRPLIVTQIRPGGAADREGSIQPGDRLLAVDSFNLTCASHSEALYILKQAEGDAIFTLEYDVSIMNCVKNAAGPLLIEIEKSPGSNLGITLGTNGLVDSGIIIESIKQASTAERSGALHVGDCLLAVDSTRTDHMTPAEVMQLLKLNLTEVVSLEILPVNQINVHQLPEPVIRKGTRTPPGTTTAQKYSIYANISNNSYPNYNTLSSMTGLAAKFSRSRRNKNSMHRNNSLTGSDGHNSSGSNGPSSHLMCHVDSTEVSIVADCQCYGIALKPADSLFTCYPIIASVDPGSPAHRSGVVKTGDRLISINRQPTCQLTLDEITQIINESQPRILLEIQFDVAESVVASSGTFNVKLAKHEGGGLGISITSPKNRKCGDPLTISHVKKGSVAHRSGTIQAGDLLMAIDGVRMENCTVEDAAQILHNCDDIVQLRIKKDETYTDESQDDKAVVYTVELARHGGPIGITLSGTEELFEPIIISGLTPNGLAHKTGAVHVGDRLLAINGQTLRGKALSQAIAMLQSSTDIITLKICKNVASNHKHQSMEGSLFKVSTPLPSCDSAVESWDSSGLYENSNSGPGSRATSSRPSSANPEEGASVGSSSKRSSQLSNPAEDSSSLTGWRKDQWKLSSNRKNSLTESDKEEWSQVLDDIDNCGQSLMLRQLEKTIVGSDDDCMSLSNTSAFETVRRNPHLSTNIGLNLRYNKWRTEQAQTDQTKNKDEKLGSLPDSGTRLVKSDENVRATVEIHQVTLFKDGGYDDFGFSLSDGLYERGVFVNRIRPDGPADQCALLKPFDRILQVNETKTEYFDCCLIVPLIAASEDKINLVVSRKPDSELNRRTMLNNLWIEENYQSNRSSSSSSPGAITKTL